MDSNTPDPVTHLTDDTEFDAFLVPQGDFLVASGHQHVLSSWVEADRAGIEAKLLVRADSLHGLSTANRVNRELLVPASADQDVVTRVKLLRAEPEAPDWLGRLLDNSKFGAIFVTEENLAIVERNREDLAVGGPVAVKALLLRHEFVDVLSFRLPEAEIVIRARCQTLQDRVEAKRLDGCVVGVLEQTDTLS